MPQILLIFCPGPFWTRSRPVHQEKLARRNESTETQHFRTTCLYNTSNANCLGFRTQTPRFKPKKRTESTMEQTSTNIRTHAHTHTRKLSSRIVPATLDPELWETEPGPQDRTRLIYLADALTTRTTRKPSFCRQKPRNDENLNLLPCPNLLTRISL